MIPKIIHYCWFGQGKKDALFQKCIASWQEILPEYEFKEWNENNFDVNSVPFTKEAYACRKWAYVADYVRLHALYHEGGVYMDTDVEVLKPFDRFLDDVAFAGFEPGGCVGTAIMATEKGGAWVSDLLRDYQGRHFLGADGQPNMTVNTVYASRVMRNRGMRLDQKEEVAEGYVHLYPTDFFFPKKWESNEVSLTQNSYTIHHYVSSWLPLSGRVARWFTMHKHAKMGYYVGYFLRRPDVVFFDLADYFLIKVLKLKEKHFLI